MDENKVIDGDQDLVAFRGSESIDYYLKSVRFNYKKKSM